jgi:hypothetical protein
LCVTRGEQHALAAVRHMHMVAASLDAELLLVLDGPSPQSPSFNGWAFQANVRSGGYIESVLDQALAAATRSYVLRIDDDERCSAGMVHWLDGREYETAQHWKFPRAHLWGDAQHVLMTPQLWPDYQTRLSWRQFAGGRNSIHAGSPHGGGQPAPYAIEHHKFLVRSLEARREIVARYDAIEPGAGSRFRAFSCPEDYYSHEELRGAVRRWDGIRPAHEAVASS